ncbi:hypothetical protein BGP_2108 [Beggiatoa sp. PS]|nr:hypothetical protein BGP_2108 [Beggiatoa sp. PS]
MQNITLRSHIGADGNLQLNIPTTLPNTELEVLIFLHPVKSSNFNKKFKSNNGEKNHAKSYIRFSYWCRWYFMVKSAFYTERSQFKSESDYSTSNFRIQIP